MSELEQLKKRITDSAGLGLETSIIRDDYEPAGDLMMRTLLDSGEFVLLKVHEGAFEYVWKIYRRGCEPY